MLPTVAYFLTKNESNHNYSVTLQGSIAPQIPLHVGNDQKHPIQINSGLIVAYHRFR